MDLNRENMKKIALIAGGTAVLYWALNNFADVQHGVPHLPLLDPRWD